MPRSRPQEPTVPGMPNFCCSITVANFAVLGTAIQQHPRDAQQTLNTEISHGRCPQGQCWCCFLSRAMVGLTPPLPSVPARDAGSTTMLSTMQKRTSHPQPVGLRSLPILSIEDSPSLESQQSWQGGKLPQPLLLFSTFLTTDPNPINLRWSPSRLILGQTAPWCESIQLG